MLQHSVHLKPCQNGNSEFAKYYRSKTNKIITSNMYQNAGTKMHEKAAALDRVVHYIYHDMV